MAEKFERARFVHQSSCMKSHWSVPAWYLLFGVAWIFSSDWLLEVVCPGKEVLSSLQTIKGLLFVVLSALLVWFLTKRFQAAQAAAEAEKFAVFQKTVEGAHHILLNYVNQMQILTVAAEECPGFDPDALKTAEQVSNEVVEALARLDRVANVTSTAIDAAIYEDLRQPKQK
jgi:hypothetical protein